MASIVCSTLSGNETDECLIRAVYDILPEDGAFLLLMSREGQIRSDQSSEHFPLACLDGPVWQDIVMRLDDGDDPVIMGVSESTLVATELPRLLGIWSYAVVVMPQRSVESVLQNFDLIQMVLGQIGLFFDSANQSMACQGNRI